MLSIADLARAEQRVFPTHARVERYYPAAASEEARGILGRCLDRGEGPALLIGSPGTGKSMLLEVLADDLGKNRPVVCLTSAQLCTRRALLQSILFELGQSYRQRDEGDLRLTLMDYLSSSDARKAGVLLLVDEAQALPIRLLEELRVLGNLAYQGVPTVRLLLAGSQSLEETFTEPEIEAFNQRIVARCYLAPLSHHDTAQFIRGHLAAAGASPDSVFTTDALDAAYRATNGIARLVNQVCDRALWLAAGHGQLQVTKQIVEGAWADLQQLPTPWNLPDTPEAFGSQDDDADGVVEFGPLSEDGDDAQAERHGAGATSAAPMARMYEPNQHEPEHVAPELEEPETWQAASDTSVASPPRDPKPERHNEPSSASQSFPTDDDLFGGDFDEEEVLIDEYASFEQAIPPSRPKVSSTCDAELGRMLQDVMDAAHPTLAGTTTAGGGIGPPDSEHQTCNRAVAGLSLVEQPHDENDAVPMDGTELDEEPEDLFHQVGAIASEASRLAAPNDEPRQHATLADWSDEDVDILVVEDETSSPASSAAAHRADYRQLFKTLRNN